MEENRPNRNKHLLYVENMIQEKVTFSSSQIDVSPIALSNEPKNKHNKHNIILMSHKHRALLLGLASMENG